MSGQYVLNPDGSYSQQVQITGNNFDTLLKNQKQIINVLNDEKIIMGVYWDKTENPTMIRTDASVGLVANVGKDGELVRNDFDNMPIYRDIGEVTDDYGNVFIKIPKFYIQKVVGSTFEIHRISKTKYPGFYLPWCFWDFDNGKELDYFLFGAYKGSLSDDGLRLESKPGKYPLVNKNIVDFRNLALANNDIDNGLNGYQQHDLHAFDALATLIIVEFAALDSQSIMPGYTTGQYTNTHLAVVAETQTNRIIVPTATANLYRVGQAISVGTTQGGNQIFYGRSITKIEQYDENNSAIYFDGSPVDIAVGNMLYNTGWKNGFSRDIAASSGYIVANDGKYPCSYRGIESPWGDVWQFVDGVNIIDNQAWVAKNAQDYTSNVFASPYEKLGFINANANGYVKYMGFDKGNPYARFAVDVSGSPSTYYSDYYYQTTGQKVALVGGLWADGSGAGLFRWYLSSSSSSAHVAFGGRLLKKPL